MKAQLRYTIKFGNADLGTILAGSNEEACMRAELMAWEHLADMLSGVLGESGRQVLHKEVRHRFSAHFGVTAIVANRDGQRIRCRLSRRVDL